MVGIPPSTGAAITGWYFRSGFSPVVATGLSRQGPDRLRCHWPQREPHIFRHHIIRPIKICRVLGGLLLEQHPRWPSGCRQGFLLFVSRVRARGHRRLT
jgi:hypothetical protein